MELEVWLIFNVGVGWGSDCTRVCLPGNRNHGDIFTGEQKRAALIISNRIYEFNEVRGRPELRKRKQCKDDLASMQCVGQDIARNEISQVGEDHIRVLKATILNMYSVDIKIYFRYMVYKILEKTGTLYHDHRSIKRCSKR